MDAGHWVRVKITLDGDSRSATIDFAGTSPVSKDNFNAPASIARAAVLYVFRTLIESDIPLNAGCSRPLKVIIPPGCLLNPEYPAAVVAGNVETSQCVTDALYGALGILAGSQGTSAINRMPRTSAISMVTTASPARRSRHHLVSLSPAHRRLEPRRAPLNRVLQRCRRDG